MADAKSLKAIANILSGISENPLDISLHMRHIQLANTLDDLETQLSAFQMMSDLVAVGDDVWLPLLEAKTKSVDLDTEEGVEELLQLYERAEGDYLSIPILQQHLNFIIANHERYAAEESKPEALGEVFSTLWSLAHMQVVVSKGLNHLSQSRLLFDPYKDWIVEQLETATQEEKLVLIEQLEELLNQRLQQPHSNSDETFQAYSSFTTKYQPAAQYEPLMVAASKNRAASVKTYERREPLELLLESSNNSLDVYAQYVAYERKGRTIDPVAAPGIYERAIAEAANRRHKGEPGAEAALAAFWPGYLDTMRILDVELDTERELYTRALRSVPTSGEVWARYVRFLERASSAMEAPQELESIPDAYNRALLTGFFQSDMEQIIPLTLAYAGSEFRKVKAGEVDDSTLPTLIVAVESAMEVVQAVSKAGDPKFRLEKFLAGVYEAVGLVDSAIEVWSEASKKYKNGYSVWLNYTETLVKHQRFDEARQVFAEVHTKRIDWPEAIWEAWVTFEHLHGTLDDINAAIDKIEKAHHYLNDYRAKEMKKAYQAQAEAPGAQQAAQVESGPSNSGTQPPIAQDATPMEVDVAPAPASDSKKRRSGDDEQNEGNKRARFEPNPPSLKRDRENTTVFVAGLPSGVTEEELKQLFKDCGRVREVKTTQLPNNLVALVEFYERDSVPAALTKDKKKLHDQEIAVHLAWKSTLYVTNFPEFADDAYIRNMFGPYGTLFDVRWPSKKFKNTRRFCYVQYTSPQSAQQALELHGKELEPNLPLNVYISNPERRKERTDHDANEREIYVAGLSRFTNKEDLEKVFSTYGKVKDIRIAVEDGHAKGWAFIEYEDPQEARKALDANNYELKKRRIAVTLADPRVRARHRSETGLSRVAEARNRSVRVRNLPPNTQEGLLQQVFEKVSAVRRVEVFTDKNEAVVELENAAEAGKLLLRTEPLTFQDHVLSLSEEGKTSGPGTAPPAPKSMPFVPRKAGAPSRPKAGLGYTRGPTQAASAASSTPASGTNKGQDDFRKMLGGR
ncbi:RNA-binding protein Prp24 [Coprinopsis marcescibilis]|uniref:U4/U6 snRNA-associated-splicing factor PRP24 n=1 Tax=Coprinopsis marcescibilis TaxID=230819 RepID=A0A5C3LHI8_COPMA|nr:RNA-binding protein Prp24 [Coprinopsis marcescibilis]